MKNILAFILFAFAFTSCKKTVENAQEDALIQIMTNGQWSVTSYHKGNDTVTADFSGYKFQFRSNKTVEAIKNNSIEKTGTWEGNALARSIFSNFANAAHPLLLLNGTFIITDSGLTYVEANQTVNGELRRLRLDKT
ncbi:MAG: hypothetical protein ABR503_13795 [Chitinophagaceae bacterium]